MNNTLKTELDDASLAHSVSDHKQSGISISCESDTENGHFTADNEPNAPRFGARAAYLTLLGSFLVLFSTFGQINSFGTYQAWYRDHQLSDQSPAIIPWIGTLQLFFYFFSV